MDEKIADIIAKFEYIKAISAEIHIEKMHKCLDTIKKDYIAVVEKLDVVKNKLAESEAKMTKNKASMDIIYAAFMESLK